MLVSKSALRAIGVSGTLFALIGCSQANADGSLDYSAQSQVEYLTAAFITAPGGDACPDDAGTAVISAHQEIAAVRAMAGLAPMDCNAAASHAAEKHCAYVLTAGVLTHDETPGNADFTGKTVFDRLAAAGFQFEGSGEVLATLTGQSAVLDPRGWLNSVYHRPFFLRAENVVFGYGDDGACSGVAFGRKPKTAVTAPAVVWPPANATNVPTEFYASRETPNPVPDLDDVVGSPVSWIGTTPLTNESGTLTGPDGSVDLRVLTHANDPNHLVREGEVHLVPTKPLTPHTRYTATFQANSAVGQLSAKTVFTTGDSDRRWTQ